MYKYHIVVPFYNAENYIEKNIKSIQDQNFKNFKVSIINDCSSDESNKKILPLVENDKRFNIINNKINCGALANIINVLSKDENEPSKTIDVLLDGDDYLLANDVLDIINFTYSRTKCLLTYGSFIRKSDGKLYGRKYPIRSINKREFRKIPWFAYPLRTFRHDLYQNIDQNDLKDEEGNYYSSGWDVALMLPMLEMAEYRQEFIADPLYFYNDDNPICDHKLRRKEQEFFEKQIRDKPIYKKINLPY